MTHPARGCFDEAGACFDRVLTLYRELDDLHGEANVLYDRYDRSMARAEC